MVDQIPNVHFKNTWTELDYMVVVLYNLFYCLQLANVKQSRNFLFTSIKALPTMTAIGSIATPIPDVFWAKIYGQERNMALI